ncbi:hypothetical protein ACFX2G_044289 [Malus domestica]
MSEMQAIRSQLGPGHGARSLTAPVQTTGFIILDSLLGVIKGQALPLILIDENCLVAAIHGFRRFGKDEAFLDIVDREHGEVGECQVQWLL